MPPELAAGLFGYYPRRQLAAGREQVSPRAHRKPRVAIGRRVPERRSQAAHEANGTGPELFRKANDKGACQLSLRIHRPRRRSTLHLRQPRKTTCWEWFVLKTKGIARSVSHMSLSPFFMNFRGPAAHGDRVEKPFAKNELVLKKKGIAQIGSNMSLCPFFPELSWAGGPYG
jgi:hypothetical protein